MTSLENDRGPLRRSRPPCVFTRYMRRVVVLSISLVPTGGGCTGRAVYTIASLDMKRLGTGEKLTRRIDARECYHWMSDRGELCVAMRMRDPSLLGKRFSASSIASFVLGGPPASSGRNYTATRRTARFVNHAGYAHTRAASLTGIVGVWDYHQRMMSGRFRFITTQQSYSVLTGWRGRKRVLYAGEFHSVRDRPRGEAILSQTEEMGMGRTAPIIQPQRIQGPLSSRPSAD